MSKNSVGKTGKPKRRHKLAEEKFFHLAKELSKHEKLSRVKYFLTQLIQKKEFLEKMINSVFPEIALSSILTDFTELLALQKKLNEKEKISLTKAREQFFLELKKELGNVSVEKEKPSLEELKDFAVRLKKQRLNLKKLILEKCEPELNRVNELIIEFNEKAIKLQR